MQKALVTNPDLIGLAVTLAAERFGSEQTGETDGIFNAANFSAAFCELARVVDPIDGRIVAAILSGRRDVVRLPDGAHYVALEASRRTLEIRGLRRMRDNVDMAQNEQAADGCTNGGSPRY